MSVRGYGRALQLRAYLEKEPDGILDQRTREAAGTFQADDDTAPVVDYTTNSNPRAAMRDALRALELGE